MTEVKKVEINHEAWAESLTGFIKSKGLERECKDYCGGFPNPVSTLTAEEVKAIREALEYYHNKEKQGYDSQRSSFMLHDTPSAKALSILGKVGANV